MSLNTRTQNVFGFFDFPNNVINKELIKKLEEYLRSSCQEWYYILHDNEQNLSTGKIKVNHVHFLFKCEEKEGNTNYPRLSTHIRNIADYLGIDTQLVSARVWKEHDSGIQYLIHKNQPEKSPYLPSDVITSISEEEKNFILNRELDNNIISMEYLIYLCETSRSRSDIYRAIGLNNAKVYRGIINDMFAEFHKSS